MSTAANVTTKTTVRTKVSAVSESHSRTLLRTRDLIDIADEPEVRGGTNEGFAPTEMAIAAFLACTNVIGHKVAKMHGIDIQSMEIDADAEFNRLGVTLQEEVDVPFPEIRLTIRLTTSSSDKELEALKRDLPRFCPVGKVFEQSGTKVVTDWVITKV